MVNLLLNELKTIANIRGINPNKAGKFEVSFFWGRGGGVSLPPPPRPSYFKKNFSNINITLCNC